MEGKSTAIIIKMSKCHTKNSQFFHASKLTISYFCYLITKTNYLIMKKRVLNILTVIVIMITVVGCKDKAKEANTSEAEAAAVGESTSEKYVANATESSIEWKGFKPTGTHSGSVPHVRTPSEAG